MDLLETIYSYSTKLGKIILSVQCSDLTHSNEPKEHSDTGYKSVFII